MENEKFIVEIKAYNVFGDEEDLELQLDSKSEFEFDTQEEAEHFLELEVNHSANYCFGMWIKAWINDVLYINDMKLL